MKKVILLFPLLLFTYCSGSSESTTSTTETEENSQRIEQQSQENSQTEENNQNTAQSAEESNANSNEKQESINLSTYLCSCRRSYSAGPGKFFSIQCSRSFRFRSTMVAFCIFI